MFKHFPLNFHKQAKDAAIASMAAHKQGKFWEYHDLMFSKMKEIKQGRPALLKFAQELKLDMDKFKADLNDPSIKEQVEKDMSEGARVGVSGTPTFFVNGRKLEAGGTLKALQKGINKELLRLGFKESDLPKGPSISIKGAPTLGKKGAPVVLAEYSDFQ